MLTETGIKKLEIVNGNLGMLTKNEDGTFTVVGINSGNMKSYLETDYLGDLETDEIESHTSLKHRKLNEDEVHEMTVNLYEFNRSIDRAVKKLVIKDFREQF